MDIIGWCCILPVDSFATTKKAAASFRMESVFHSSRQVLSLPNEEGWPEFFKCCLVAVGLQRFEGDAQDCNIRWRNPCVCRLHEAIHQWKSVLIMLRVLATCYNFFLWSFQGFCLLSMADLRVPVSVFFFIHQHRLQPPLSRTDFHD